MYTLTGLSDFHGFSLNKFWFRFFFLPYNEHSPIGLSIHPGESCTHYTQPCKQTH